MQVYVVKNGLQDNAVGSGAVLTDVRQAARLAIAFAAFEGALGAGHATGCACCHLEHFPTVVSTDAVNKLVHMIEHERVTQWGPHLFVMELDRFDGAGITEGPDGVGGTVDSYAQILDIPPDDEEFRRLIRACPLSDDELAHELEVTRPTLSDQETTTS